LVTYSSAGRLYALAPCLEQQTLLYASGSTASLLDDKILAPVPRERRLMNRVLRFLKDEDGPTALEYAFVISLILVAAIAGITFFGQATNDSMGSSAGSIK